MSAVAAGSGRYPAVPLRDIALRDLEPRKVTLAWYGPNDHRRWVLEGRLPDVPGACWFKLWNPGYVRRDNLPAAVAAGFYDERLAPALIALIWHAGLCRGYVMHAGRTRHGQSIAPLREELYARTRDTGWFMSQFSAWHTLVYQGRLSVLDLEAVFPLRDLPRLPDWEVGFDDPEYLRFVAGLYESRRRGSAGGPTPEDCAAGWERFGSTAVRARHPLVRRLWAGPRQRLARAYRNLRPHLDLIQGVPGGPRGN